MSLTVNRTVNAVVHWFEGNRLIASKGPALLESTDGGISWRKICSIGHSLSIAGHSRILRRLLRAGIHHVRPLSSGRLLIVASGHTYVFNGSKDSDLSAGSRVEGSRPLALATVGDDAYYGEYRGNPDRRPVHIWHSDDCRSWQPVWTFRSVRHVHAVAVDPWTQDIWVTTGDEGDEAGLWRTVDRFRTLERVIGGTQQARIVQPLFTSDSIFFGTDAPLDDNYIYRLDRNSYAVEPLCRVDGPVFYGCRCADVLFFGTVCEPTHKNETRVATVWGGLADGSRWSRLLTFRKDWLPMRLFQYGQVQFPAGTGNDTDVWLTPFATVPDQVSLRFSLEEIRPK